ncbi:hypothetical protein UCDDA912_g09030 [Diaporthe ampelina]|uniref:Uncharacterized protein n=1 Tax=Diaporthe ampelina TaxID=1214573 RepID=A0A0G2FA18_9PEZI|nr:hypothetical protein UCDDA912_g09030 [Diaporthe ampelina]
MATNTRLNLKLSLARPEFFQHKKSQRLQPGTEEKEEFKFEVQEQDDSAEDATEWIKSTIREQGRWEEHLSLMRIDCPHTMAELRQLGRLSKSEGTKQCRKMIRIPVLYDEIGCFLWEKLAALERGPDFRREDEEMAAEYARGVIYRTMMALDERFRFDTQASTSASGNASPATRNGRARKDSEPVSPKHIQQSQAEHPAVLAGISADAPGATRGTFVDQQPAPAHMSRSASHSSSRMRRPAAFFNHSKSSSYSSTLLWRHDHHDSATAAASSSSTVTNGRSGSGSSSTDSSAQGRRSRDGSLGGRVGSVVGNLGRGVALAIGGGSSHGYGFGGRAERSGSLWSI